MVHLEQGNCICLNDLSFGSNGLNVLVHEGQIIST